MRKKKYLVTLVMVFVFMFSLALFSQTGEDFSPEIQKAKNSIKGRMILSHVEFLASKYCRGRKTGTEGMDVAIRYIESVFKGIGVEPAGRAGSFKQTVYLETVSLSDRIYLHIEEKKHGGKLVKKVRVEEDFLPVSISAEKEVSAALVFAGYGITAPEHKYDDYKGIDARGKIVIALRYEPREKDESSPFNGRKLSKYAALLSKIKNAQKHGAVGILFVTGPLNGDYRRPDSSGGTYWPCLYEERAKKTRKEDFKYLSFNPQTRISDEDFGVTIPAAAIDGRLCDSLLGKGRGLKNIQEQIDKTMKPTAFPLPNIKISIGIYFEKEPLSAYNLAARIEGSDPELKKEVVIVGAHYDHLGRNNRGQFYPGADDNASGTAGVIELARAFRDLEVKPKRTLLFLLFAAEEMGLLGSRYYAAHPIFPLDKTLAVVNMDMIGRNAVDQVSLLGRYQYPDLLAFFHCDHHQGRDDIKCSNKNDQA